MSTEDQSSEEHSAKGYVKIWGILLVLLVISIVGPELGIRSVTLITAFGIAVVKALIVAREFMHIKIERKYISYMMLSMLLMVIVFYAGTVVDIQKHEGQNWVKTYVEPTPEEVNAKVKKKAVEEHGADGHSHGGGADHSSGGN